MCFQSELEKSYQEQKKNNGKPLPDPNVTPKVPAPPHQTPLRPLAPKVPHPPIKTPQTPSAANETPKGINPKTDAETPKTAKTQSEHISRLRQVIKELAVSNSSLQRDMERKIEASKQKAKIICELKDLEKSIDYSVSKICRLEKEKRYVLNNINHKAFE